MLRAIIPLLFAALAVFAASPSRVFTKTIAVNGVQPTPQTIADGSYPLRAPIYAAIHKDTPPDAPARRIFDFLTTPAGQKLVQAAGYVPVTP